MGNGCLKPTPRNGEIYIDCINKIYEEVKEFDSSTVKNDFDLYSIIKEKIQKKGWLRKLIDNLTSHRESISEAALHNFRLMTQNKGTFYKVTGLIVIDFIVTAVLRESGLEAADKVTNYAMKLMQERDMNAQSEYEESQPKHRQSYEPSRQSFPNSNKPKPPTPLTQPSLYNAQNIESSNSSHPSRLPINDPRSVQNNCLMLRQIYNVKFSNIFYNMIQSLIASQDGIYAQGVRSIITYTRFHTVKNIQQEKIEDLLQVLLEHIQTGEEVNLSLKAYEMLVQKLKDSFLENQIKQFRSFLKIWQEAYKQLNDQETHKLQTQVQNRMFIENIIHKMISSMIGSVGINKIYEQIIAVYDHNKFENMIHFQEMLISITKRDQLKNQFFRGIFSFLLSYLAVCRGNGMGTNVKAISSIKNINGSSLIVQKWPTINSVKSYEAFINDYENILDIKTKKSVIETLKRWAHSHQFIEINEIIKYNSSLLLKSFLFNIHECFLNDIVSNSSIKTQNSQQLGFPSGSRNFARFLATEFCEHFCKTAEIEQRTSLVNQLLDEVKSIEIQDQEKLLYLDMANSLMYEEWVESTKIIEFCQVDSSYSKALNLELLTHANIFINKFTEKMLIMEIDHIAYLLYSFFDLLSKASLPYHELVSFLNGSIKLCQTIERSQGSLVVLAFTERMAKAMSNEMDKQNFFICWDLILNCTNMLYASPRNYNRESTKKILNEIYIKTTLNEQLKSGVGKIPQSQFDERVQKILVDSFGDLTDLQQQQNLLRIQLPKPEDFEAYQLQTGSHQKIYELASIAFRDMFSRGVSRAKGDFMQKYEEQVSFQSQANGFGRANSIISEREVGHEEKSMAQVMDMINI